MQNEIEMKKDAAKKVLQKPKFFLNLLEILKE